MSDNDLSNWPVIRSLAEAQAHDPDLPALIPVPGHLVRPLHLLVDHLHAETPQGELARGVELLLIGLTELDSACLLAGQQKVDEAIAELARTPLEVAAEVSEEEPQLGATVRPQLAVLHGGWEDPPVVEAGEADDDADVQTSTSSALAIDVGGGHERE